MQVEACTARKGTAAYGGACHILNTQGPCPDGSWLVKEGTGKVKCQCRPGRVPPECNGDIDPQAKS